MQDALRASDPLRAEWVTVLLFLVVASLIAINRGAPRQWRSVVRAAFSMRLGRQALREEMDLQDRSFLGLLLIGATLLTLFAWQVLTFASIPGAFLSLLGVLIAVLLAHTLLMSAVNLVMRNAPGVEEYLFTGFVLFIVAGLVLLPLVVFVAYRPPWRPWAVGVGAVLLVLVLLYRWLRGVWIGLGEGVPLRYIILYFCAAELTPVLLVVAHWRSTHPSLFHS